MLPKILPIQLLPYMAHKLKMIDVDSMEISTLFKVDSKEDEFYSIAGDNYEVYNSKDYHMLPILRSPADIAQNIVVEGYNNGKEFSPICQLFFEVFGSMPTEEPHIMDDQLFVVFTNNKKTKQSLVFYPFEKCFKTYEVEDEQSENPLFDQYRLFELLKSWHFDLYNLIGEGKAIHHLMFKNILKLK